jgi:hypothetical protein
MQDVSAWTLATGLFGGIGATMAWEIFLRPTRARLQLAEVLSAEVSHNIQMVGGGINTATAKMVRSDFSLSTMVFDAVVGDLGLLPTALIGDVVLLYRHFGELNRLRGEYVAYVDQIRREETAGSPHVPQLKLEAQRVIDVFNGSLLKTRDRLNLVQPRLLACAFPWWSLRTWTRHRSESLDLESLRQNAQKSEAERQAFADFLRRRDEESAGGTA